MKIKDNIFQTTKSYGFKENKKIIENKIRDNQEQFSEIWKIDKDNNFILSEMEEKRILKKIARGDRLSEKEKSKLKNIDPEKIRMAESAKRRKEEVEKKLKNAKSKEEAKRITNEVNIELSMSLNGVDSLYGELLSEAIKSIRNKWDKTKENDESIMESSSIFDKRI